MNRRKKNDVEKQELKKKIFYLVQMESDRGRIMTKEMDIKCAKRKISLALSGSAAREPLRAGRKEGMNKRERERERTLNS